MSKRQALLDLGWTDELVTAFLGEAAEASVEAEVEFLPSRMIDSSQVDIHAFDFKTSSGTTFTVRSE